MSEILKGRMLVALNSQAIGAVVTQAVYDSLMTGSSADMMLESVSIDDIDHTFLGNELLAQQSGAMFEAITTERIRLANTMRAFVRSLQRGLNGTGISAGTDDAGADTDGQNTVGGAVIGKVRRVANIPVLSALIPLSDGQSVSLVFHSPTADGGKIRNQDTLVAFQFLVNKRDVTHIVAPIGGRDVSLLQVTQALANLVEKNSGKFTKQKDAQAKLRTEVDAVQAEADQLAEQQSTLLSQVEEQQARAYAQQDNEQSLRGKLASQHQINADLSSKLAAMQQAKSAEPANTDTFSDRTIQVKAQLNMNGSATLSNGATVVYSTQDVEGELKGKVVITEADGTTYEMPSPSSQTGKMSETATKMLKVYRTGAADKFLVKPEVPESVSEPEPAATKRKLTASATEMTKGQDAERDGRLLMALEGPEDFIRYADEKMRELYESAGYEEEGAKEGDIVIFFGVNRGDKSVFMKDWKQVKADWMNGAELPVTQQPSEQEPVQQEQLSPAEPEAVPEAVEPDTSAVTTSWRYALVNRPAGVGAVPPNFISVSDQPALGQPYSGVARNGVITYDRKLSDKEISDFELKLIPTHGDLDAMAATVAERMGNYASEYLEMANDDPDTYTKQVRMLARKEVPNVAYPEGDDVAYFNNAVKAALQNFANSSVGQGEPEVKEVPNELETTAPFWIAAKRLGDLIGWTSELVNSWAETLGYDGAQMASAADYVSEHATPEYLEAVNAAMIMGKRIPQVEELTAASEPQPGAVPEPQSQPVSEPEPKPEADTVAQKAITYLQGLASLQTDDMDVIRDGRSQVREAIAALNAAGVFEENEGLVNEAVQHLSDLLVAVQRSGAAV